MSFNELGSTRPKFTSNIQRDVYGAIDPSKSSLALPGKTVLITGAGRGIGISVVEAFAKAQVETIILTGRSETSLIKAKAEFEKTYPKVQFIVATVDIGVLESVNALFADLKGKVKTIDVLVNNAAVLFEFGPRLGDTDVDKFWEAMAVNARGPYLLARAQIQFNPPDHPTTYITFTTGVTEPFFGSTGYIVSKLPAVKLVEVLALEYPNLRSFTIIPGIIATDMMLPEMASTFKPLALDKPALSGGLSVWLCHPEADFLSGRFLDSRWDIEQVLERKEEIVGQDLLKLRIGGY